MKKLVKEREGMFTIGIFATAIDGSITLTTRAITAVGDGNPTITKPQIEQCGIGPCAVGMTGVFTEYPGIIKGQEIISTPSPSVSRRFNPVAINIIRLVDLTIAFDPTGEVGGQIDALEMSTDGNIIWVQRKNNCEAFEN